MLPRKNFPLLTSIGLEGKPDDVFVVTSNHTWCKGGNPCLRMLTSQLSIFKVYPIIWMSPYCFKQSVKGSKCMFVRPGLMNLANSSGNSRHHKRTCTVMEKI